MIPEGLTINKKILPFILKADLAVRTPRRIPDTMKKRRIKIPAATCGAISYYSKGFNRDHQSAVYIKPSERYRAFHVGHSSENTMRFPHVLRNGSGAVRKKIDDVFGHTLSNSDKRSLATLIYYPKERWRL